MEVQVEDGLLRVLPARIEKIHGRGALLIHQLTPPVLYRYRVGGGLVVVKVEEGLGVSLRYHEHVTRADRFDRREGDGVLVLAPDRGGCDPSDDLTENAFRHVGGSGGDRK
jgi:hypothetical protein